MCKYSALPWNTALVKTINTKIKILKFACQNSIFIQVLYNLQLPLLLTSSLRHYFEQAILQMAMQIDMTSHFFCL